MPIRLSSLIIPLNHCQGVGVIMESQPRIRVSGTHINVMELLVAEEVERQLRELPLRLAKYLKRSEIETFALNRLPALYASSEKGLQLQRDRAQTELKQSIQQAVRQGFAAVQGDPIRASQPLEIALPNQQAEAVLASLKQWMNAPDLTWEDALRKLSALQQRQKLAKQRSQVAVKTSQASPTAPASSYAKDSSELGSTALRPGVYGCRTTWVPKARRAQGWADSQRSVR